MSPIIVLLFVVGLVCLAGAWCWCSKGLRELEATLNELKDLTARDRKRF